MDFDNKIFELPKGPDTGEYRLVQFQSKQIVHRRVKPFHANQSFLKMEISWHYLEVGNRSIAQLRTRLRGPCLADEKIDFLVAQRLYRYSPVEVL